MITANDKLIDAIVGLIKGTQEGRITWEGGEVTSKMVYETWYKGRRLRLHKLPGSKPDLEIIDDSGTPLWTFPSVSGLDDLLSSVRYQIADVKSFVDAIIRDEELERESGVH